MSEPVMVLRHGRETWCDMDTDTERPEKCLCFRCAHGPRGGGQRPCSMAKGLLKTCKAHAMAMLITRCGSWKPLER